MQVEVWSDVVCPWCYIGKRKLETALSRFPHADQVDGVPFLLTTVIGPGQLLVAAKVDFADTATVVDIERASDEAERRLVARHPGVRYVFLDPTPGDGKARVAAPDADDVE